MESDTVAVFRELVSGVELALCLAVVAVLGPRWRRHRAAPTAAALGVFGTVGFVLAMSFFEPADTTGGWGAVWSDVLIVVLLAIPYLLVRFAWSLGGLSDRVHRLLGALTVLEWVVTLAAPPLPEQDVVDRPAWAVGYLVLILGIFSLQCVVAAVVLWRAGAGQASVVRHRMRSLSTGGILLALTLVLSGALGENAAAGYAVTISVLGLGSILMFALAFLPPPALRLLWRQGDIAALASAERGLMTALSRDEVAATIVPVVARVFGGGAALLDEQARPVRSTGLTPARTAELSAQLCDDPALEATPGGLLSTRLTHGWLVVQAARLTPVFGDEEVVLLERVGTLVDLALQRALLFDQERVSRRAAESANAELETLLYSVSHDLRSPLISVLGYLDVLRQEHAAALPSDGAHYLDRISVNAVYMQSLIADLLELSRIGRSEPPATPLDLGQLVEQVLEGTRLSHPAADLRAVGPFPTVRMSDVRARQLLTNLVDNALKHGGRDDLRLTVTCTPDDIGVRLDVADDGRGIPPEYRERVLRVFERLDAARSSTGTGMGLAICKRIVDTIGGTLVVGGPPEGAPTGTTVAVLLPADVVIPDVPLPREAPTAPAVRTTIEEKA